MKRRLLITLAIILALLAACRPAANPTASPTASAPIQSAAPRPTQIVPKAGMGGISGQVAGAAARWPDGDVTIYAAPFTETGSGNGFYALEPNQHPHGPLDANGFFQLNDVPPGAYVLVVGPDPESALLVVNPGSQVGRVFTVKPDQVLQLGSLSLAN